MEMTFLNGIKSNRHDVAMLLNKNLDIRLLDQGMMIVEYGL